MPKTGRMGALSGALLAACAMLAVAPAPVRAEVNEVHIGIQYGLIYLPVVVADAQGFFAIEAKKAGLPDLKVTVQRFSGSPAITDAVLSGNIDVGAFGTPGLLIAWEETKGHQNVAGLAALGANSFVLMTNKPEIKTIADFGNTDQIAVPATTSPQAVVMRMAAEQTFGDYRRLDKLLVAMPHPDATAALLSGRIISGYVATAPFISVLRKSDNSHRHHLEGRARRGDDRRRARRAEKLCRCQSDGGESYRPRSRMASPISPMSRYRRSTPISGRNPRGCRAPTLSACSPTAPSSIRWRRPG